MMKSRTKPLPRRPFSYWYLSILCLALPMNMGCLNEIWPSKQDPFESEETEVPAPGQTITVDWDMDNPAHPAYFDVPAWNTDDALFMYMKHDEDAENQNRDDCYITTGDGFDRVIVNSTLNADLKPTRINSEPARNVGCVWSGADPQRVFYMHYNGEKSCLRRIDLSISPSTSDGPIQVDTVDQQMGDCHQGKMQMTPTYSQHSINPDYVGWVLLAPTEGIDVQKAYLFNEYGEKDAFPEGLHEINLDELIPHCNEEDYPDLSVFHGDATCHNDDEGYNYLEDRCGFVHRVRLANRGNEHGPFVFASNSMESFILKPMAQPDGSIEWAASKIHDGDGAVRCAKHPAISPDGKNMVYLRKRWDNGGTTFVSVVNLPVTDLIEEHDVQYNHDWDVGSGAHPAFRYPVSPFETGQRQIIIDSRPEGESNDETNGWIYLIKGETSADREELVKHQALWNKVVDFTQNTQDLWNIDATPFDGKKQYAHPHPTTSNDGSLVTFGTNFFAYSAAPPDQPIDPSVEPQVSNEPRCCGLKVYRFDED